MEILKVALLSVVFVIFILSFCFNKAITRFFASYIRTVVVAIFVLVYSVVVMWAPGIRDYIDASQSISTGGTSSAAQLSNFVSYAFLLQLPCLMSIVFPIALIIDKTKTVAKSMAPFLIVYSMLALVIRFIGYETITMDQNVTWYNYILFGEPGDRLFFLSNVFCIFLPLFTYISCKTYTKYSFFGGVLIILIVVAYYSLVINIKSVYVCASGLVEGDWVETEGFIAMYKPLNNFLPIDNFALKFNFWFFLYLIITLLLVFFKNYFTVNPNKMTYVYQPWYFKFTFLKGFLAPFDAAINNLLNAILPYGYFFPKKLKEFKLKNFRTHYNGFIALGDMERYERYMHELEQSLTNNENHKLVNETSLAIRKNKKSKKEVADLQKQKLEQLEKEIEEQLKEVDHKKTIKKNKKMQKMLEKEAKNSNVILERNNEIAKETNEIDHTLLDESNLNKENGAI